jgi:hypothetical protein
MNELTDPRSGTSGPMAHPGGAIWTERLLVGFILAALAGTLNLIIAVHRNSAVLPTSEAPLSVAEEPLNPPSLPVVQSPRASASSQSAKPIASAPERVSAEELTKQAVARFSAATSVQVAALEGADKRAQQLEAARKTAVAESQRWKRRELLVRQQIDVLSRHATHLEEVATTLDAERDVLARERDALKAALTKAAGRRASYAVLPYKGPNGTWRRPIVLECTSGGVILRPGGQRFSGLELSPRIHPRSSPIVRAVAREMLHINGAETPDGAPAIPYLVFLVRPDGVRPYYESRSSLEPLGIAFGYELIDQNMVVDIPNLDDLATWDGSVPLDLPLEKSPASQQLVAGRNESRAPQARGIAGTGGNTVTPEDFVWPSGSSTSNDQLPGRAAASAPGQTGANDSGSSRGLANAWPDTRGAASAMGGTGEFPGTGRVFGSGSAGGAYSAPGFGAGSGNSAGRPGSLSPPDGATGGGRGQGAGSSGIGTSNPGSAIGSGELGGQSGSPITTGGASAGDSGLGSSAAPAFGSGSGGGEVAGRFRPLNTMGGAAVGVAGSRAGATSAAGSGSSSGDIARRSGSLGPASGADLGNGGDAGSPGSGTENDVNGSQGSGFRNGASAAQPADAAGRPSGHGGDFVLPDLEPAGAVDSAPKQPAADSNVSSSPVSSTVSFSDNPPGAVSGATPSGTMPAIAGLGAGAPSGSAFNSDSASSNGPAANATASGQRSDPAATPYQGFRLPLSSGSSANATDAVDPNPLSYPGSRQGPADGSSSANFAALPPADLPPTGTGSPGNLQAMPQDSASNLQPSAAAMSGAAPGTAPAQSASGQPAAPMTAGVASGMTQSQSTGQGPYQATNSPSNPDQARGSGSLPSSSPLPPPLGTSTIGSPSSAGSGSDSSLGSPSTSSSTVSATSSFGASSSLSASSAGQASTTPAGVPLGLDSSMAQPGQGTPSLGLGQNSSSKSDSDDDFAPPHIVLPDKPPGSIDVAFEIVVVCRENSVLLHPGGYLITSQRLKEPRGDNESLLARELRAMVRKRALVDPLIRPRPSIKFLVETNGDDTFWLARRQIIFEMPDWPVSLQVSGSHGPRVFDKGAW